MKTFFFVFLVLCHSSKNIPFAIHLSNQWDAFFGSIETYLSNYFALLNRFNPFFFFELIFNRLNPDPHNMNVKMYLNTTETKR